MPASPSAPSAPTLLQALWFWLRIGLISFGGPAGQIALMHQELVERRRWISEQRFVQALNYCMLLPGPEAQQMATYMGWLLHRSLGGIIAGLLFVLPSLLLMIGLGWLYLNHADLAWVQGMFYGIRPAVTVIVIQATWKLAGRTLRGCLPWLLAVGAFLALFAWNLPFPLIVLLAAIAGYLGGRWLPRTTTQVLKANAVRALIDDDTPLPAHTHFRWWRLLVVLVVSALLWCVPMWLLYLAYGWAGDLTQMAWFFTKAALLTFGGVYAVVPYLTQGAIMQFAWITPAQMIDALALGESTPGPLLMIVAFIAFVGAYSLNIPGLTPGFDTAVVAAVLVTWFTFLPSFVFILAGAPLVEATRDKLPLTAALAGVSAAVVGVVANLALFFTYHVFWPQDFAVGLDLWALAIAGIAVLALGYGKRTVVQVIALCALLGAARALLLA